MITTSRRLAAVLATASALGAGAALPAVSSAQSFHTPTGNIHCSTGYRSIVCSMDAPQLSVRLSAYGGRPQETSRIAGYGAQTIRYGHTLQNSRMRCTSSYSGLRCSSRVTGHGFFLAKQGSYRW